MTRGEPLADAADSLWACRRGRLGNAPLVNRVWTAAAPAVSGGSISPRFVEIHTRGAMRIGPPLLAALLAARTPEDHP